MYLVEIDQLQQTEGDEKESEKPRLEVYKLV